MAMASSSPIDPTPPPSSSSGRRLPPPCWSDEETVALIDSYREKWYSLNRSNLKAEHWHEVASVVPAKTAVQCRHKMEKLRKRYRSDLLRSGPNSSSWIHFHRMHATIANNTVSDDDDEDDDDSIARGRTLHHKLYPNVHVNVNANANAVAASNGIGIGIGNGNGNGGFRIRIPSGVSVAHPGSGHKFIPSAVPSPNYRPGPGPNFGARVLRDCGSVKRERDGGDPLDDVVAAIRVLGDGFVKVEQMKMDMAREIESMRMDMEMKRTEMVLESQQRIVEAFAVAASGKRRKAKRLVASPES